MLELNANMFSVHSLSLINQCAQKTTAEAEVNVDITSFEGPLDQRTTLRAEVS